MSQDNWTPIYSICPDTGLRVCEIYQFLLVREDGMYKNINPASAYLKRSWQCGSLSTKTYKKIGFKGKCYRIHALVALSFLEKQRGKLHVDHINGDLHDNRAENLRFATKRENQQNQKKHRKGHLLGTTFKKGRWHAYIYNNKKQSFLGAFGTAEEAHNAYMQALKEIQKEIPLA